MRGSGGCDILWMDFCVVSWCRGITPFWAAWTELSSVDEMVDNLCKIPR